MEDAGLPDLQSLPIETKRARQVSALCFPKRATQSPESLADHCFPFPFGAPLTYALSRNFHFNTNSKQL